jgi:hypothetical protein
MLDSFSITSLIAIYFFLELLNGLKSNIFYWLLDDLIKHCCFIKCNKKVCVIFKIFNDLLLLLFSIV